MAHLPHRDDHLTARELSVLRLIAQGSSNRAIAQELSISLKTVETHLTHIFQKLGVATRTQAAVWMTQQERTQSNDFGVSPDVEFRTSMVRWDSTPPH